MSTYISLYGMAVFILVCGLVAFVYGHRPTVLYPGQLYLKYVGVAFVVCGVGLMLTIVLSRS